MKIWKRIFSRFYKQKYKAIIGIGGAGANFLIFAEKFLKKNFKMFIINIFNANRYTFNSWSPSLEKILIEKEFSSKLTSEEKVKFVYRATMKNRDKIEDLFRKAKISYIITGLGGGTGSGATPAIIEIAKKNKNFVIVISFTPFKFEGKTRESIANNALEKIKKIADITINFPNQELLFNKKSLPLKAVFIEQYKRIVKLIQIMDILQSILPLCLLRVIMTFLASYRVKKGTGK